MAEVIDWPEQRAEEKVIDVISHHFYGGVYCKHLTIKDGYRVTQHKHEYPHLSVLVSGNALVECEGADDIVYTGPAIIKIPEGKNHRVTPQGEDCVWLCIHKTDCEDEASIDEVLIEKPHA